MKIFYLLLFSSVFFSDFAFGMRSSQKPYRAVDSKYQFNVQDANGFPTKENIKIKGFHNCKKAFYGQKTDKNCIQENSIYGAFLQVYLNYDREVPVKKNEVGEGPFGNNPVITYEMNEYNFTGGVSQPYSKETNINYNRKINGIPMILVDPKIYQELLKDQQNLEFKLPIDDYIFEHSQTRQNIVETVQELMQEPIIVQLSSDSQELCNIECYVGSLSASHEYAGLNKCQKIEALEIWKKYKTGKLVEIGQDQLDQEAFDIGKEYSRMTSEDKKDLSYLVTIFKSTNSYQKNKKDLIKKIQSLSQKEEMFTTKYIESVPKYPFSGEQIKKCANLLRDEAERIDPPSFASKLKTPVIFLAGVLSALAWTRSTKKIILPE